MTPSPDALSASPSAALRSGTPLSTYRLQLHGGFDFAAARSLIPYLSSLGVTHCYLSPIFRALPGSTHGYDVCRHTEISPELGGEAGFSALVEEVARHGMGLLLDFVPNHMSNDPRTNDWWRDVLENGPSSPFARFFDIDWAPIKAELEDRLLLPILGEPYGEALERGALSLRLESGGLVLDYGSYCLPINPRRSPIVLEHGLSALEETLGSSSGELREFLSVLTSLRNLPPYTERDPRRISERQREKEVARERLARLVETSPPVEAHIARAIGVFNGVPGDSRSFDRLHGLLELQAYRLASWQTAADEINYRRFFDVNGLAGLRVEDPEVFDAIHWLLIDLIKTGKATGIRLDHVDGLFDPAAYLSRLTDAIHVSQPAAYVIVEKIVAAGERLREDWPVAGTTGYTFLNEVNGLFVDRRRQKRLQRLYARFSGRREPFADVAYESKRLIVSTALGSEFQVLAQAINRFSESDRRFRDFTLASIRRALRELVACFPVYRTYVRRGGAVDLDAAILDAAVTEARRRNPAMESSIFDFLRFVLLPGSTHRDAALGESAPPRPDVGIAMRFQQYTAPVQAKGVEDTAFYRYHALASLNEVGGEPARFGLSTARWHRANSERRRHHPAELLATTTHDTKRSEDARARINVISEVPDEWQARVTEWRRLNRANRTRIHGSPAPDPNDEYLFYQALVGSWPSDLLESPLPDAAPEDLVARLSAYMQKAIREAKLHTSWITPNADYEAAVERFVHRTLAGRTAPMFLASLLPFVQRVARAGACNALAQLTLKLASPGVPDFYQGTELWDLSLVDPDNRRPVDWDRRRRLLDSLAPPSDAAAPGALLESWWDGRIKLLVTARGLQWRRAHPAVCAGDYVPLTVAGAHADHVVACARRSGTELLLVVVPRLTLSLPATDGWPVGEACWEDTSVRLPSSWGGRTFRSLLDPARLASTPTADGPVLLVGDLLRDVPVALFSAEPQSD